MINSRQRHEVNAGSMADIGFLLLIFFLVTTTILNDRGILTKLPPYVIDDVEVPYDQEYVINIRLNKFDNIMFEKEITDRSLVRKMTKAFVDDRSEPGRVNKTIVSFSCSRQASYSAYIDVYDQLKRAYAELWDHAARAKFGRAFKGLASLEQKMIRNSIPLVISEAEVD